MEFQIFIKKLEEALRKCFPENYRILIQEVKKNNGLMMHGLIIKAPDKSIAPTLFLEAFFDEYKDGTPLAVVVSGGNGAAITVVNLATQKAVYSDVLDKSKDAT